MMKRENYYHLFLWGIIFLCFVGIAFENFGSVHGKVSEGDIFSNVSVSKFLSIKFSDNLSEGILFGSVNFLPATAVNASHNYDGFLNGSTFYVNVSLDSNTEVDFCLRANDDLINSGGDRIGLANETFSVYNSTDIMNPNVLQRRSITNSFQSSGENISVGSANYWRFWLDVPLGQASGSYNNTVSIKGMQVGDSC